MNKLFQQYSNPTSINPQFSNIKRMMNTIKMATNPKQALMQNPQMQQVMQLVQQGGGDPKAIFYKLAEQKGVDPQSILDSLK